jgi:hypothetical protein
MMNVAKFSDEAWRRHANPWSVYTRFAAIPLMILAVWSRVWMGWWALVPVGLVALWLVVNPFVFSAIVEPTNWASKGIFGEKLWLQDRTRVPTGLRTILRRLILMGVAGFALLTWGLLELSVWPTVFGTTLITLAQLWRIDRMGLLYDEISRRELDG